MKSMKLRTDNILVFLRFIKGGDFVLNYTKDPKDSTSYVYSSELEINIMVGEYAVYLDDREQELSVLTEDEWQDYITPKVIKDLIKMFTILHPIVKNGVDMFSIIEDLTDGEVSVKSLGSFENEESIKRINHYELDGHYFEIIKKNNKFMVNML